MKAWDGEQASSGAEIALMKSLAKNSTRGSGKRCVSFLRCFRSHRDNEPLLLMGKNVLGCYGAASVELLAAAQSRM